jgi:hypothetical protein
MSPRAIEKCSNDSDGLDTPGIRSVGSVPDGGRGHSGWSLLPKKKRPSNVVKKSVAWDHFTKDENWPKDLPVA